MRKFLAGILLAVACAVLLPPVTAHAAGAYGIQPAFSYQTAVSSITTNIITVSTSSTTGATQMDNPQMASRVSLEIQNIDSSANLWCLPVSTMPVVNGGRKIAPGSTWAVSTMDTYTNPSYSTSTFITTSSTTTAKFWCLSDGAAATKAAVSQAY